MELMNESYLLSYEEIEKIFNYGKLSAKLDRELEKEQIEKIVKCEWL